MIAIVFALEYEGAALREPNRMCTSIWNLGVTGKHCINSLERRLKHAKPSLIVSAGFSGGLQPGLSVGSLIIGANFSSSHLVKSLAGMPGFTFGNLLTSDDVVDSSSEKRILGQSSGAISVDCESLHIRGLCGSCGIDVLSVRCISDTVDQDLPVPGSILVNKTTGRPDPFLLFRYLFSHPSKIPGFRELVRNSRTAQKSLADGLSTLIPKLLKHPTR